MMELVESKGERGSLIVPADLEGKPLGPVTKTSNNPQGTTPGKCDDAEDADQQPSGHDWPLFLKNLTVSPLQ